MKIGDVILDPQGALCELLDIYPDRELVRVAYPDENGYYTVHQCHYMHDCEALIPIAGRKVTLQPDEDWVPFKGENNE